MTFDISSEGQEWAVGSSWLNFAFWGCPDLQSRGPKILVLKGSGTSRWKIGAPQNQGKKKHININKFAGLSWVWVGGKILLMCFFWVIPYGGEKTHKHNPPKNPGTVP